MRAIAILTYHSLDTSRSMVSVAPQDFATHMACLTDLGFRGISLREAVTYRQAHGAWPAQAVVLTFDDGYATVHEMALPILIQHDFTASVFIVSGHMGGRNDWAPPPPGLGYRPTLTWSQAAELSAAGMEMASHTQTHADLRGCSASEVEREIMASCADMAQQLGQPVQSFAYPFGHVSRMALQHATRAFHAACTTVLKRAEDESLHQLPRVDMYYIRSRRHLERLVNGHLDRYLAIRRWGRTVRRVLRSPSRQG